MSKKYDDRYESNAWYCFCFKCGTGQRFLCLTHRMATLPSCTTFIGAPVSHMRSTHWQCRMAAVAAVSSGRKMVIEFVTAWGSSPIEFHRRLRSVYGEGALDVAQRPNCRAATSVFRNAEGRAPRTSCNGAGVLSCDA